MPQRAPRKGGKERRGGEVSNSAIPTPPVTSSAGRWDRRVHLINSFITCRCKGLLVPGAGEAFHICPPLSHDRPSSSVRETGAGGDNALWHRGLTQVEQPPLENHGRGPAQLRGRQGCPGPRLHFFLPRWAALASLHRTAGGAPDDHALGLPPSVALRAPSRLLLMQEPRWKSSSRESDERRYPHNLAPHLALLLHRAWWPCLQGIAGFLGIVDHC